MISVKENIPMSKTFCFNVILTFHNAKTGIEMTFKGFGLAPETMFDGLFESLLAASLKMSAAQHQRKLAHRRLAYGPVTQWAFPSY